MKQEDRKIAASLADLPWLYLKIKSKRAGNAVQWQMWELGFNPSNLQKQQQQKIWTEKSAICKFTNFEMFKVAYT